MKPNGFLVAKVFKEQGTVLISGLWDTRITILGSSIPLSAAPGLQVSSFCFSMEEGQRQGLIAVHVVRHAGKQDFSGDFLIPVRWEDGGPFVDLEDPWMPLRGRLGQVHFYGIEVVIHGKTFTTVDTSEKNSYKAKDYARDYYVPDPTIVCEYLVGEIGADAVIHVATQHKAEENAKVRVPKLERELERVTQNFHDLVSEHSKVLGENERLAGWRKAAVKLGEAVGQQLFMRPSVIAAIQEIDNLSNLQSRRGA